MRETSRATLVALAVVLLSSAAHGADRSLWEAVELGRSIVFRFYRAPYEWAFTCTGFRLSPYSRGFQNEALASYMVTAGHCLLNAGKMYRKIDEYIWHVPYSFAAVRDWDRTVDVAVLAGSEFGRAVRYPPVRTEDVLEGEVLVVVGFGGSVLRVAFCMARDGHTAFCRNESQAPTFGSSGSPVLDTSGRLVGVVFAIHAYFPGLVFFTPWKEADRVFREVSPYPREQQ